MAKKPKMSLATIIVLVVVSILALITVAAFAPDVMRHFKTQHILKQGIAATAVIKAVTDTGNRYNNNPQIKLTLEVTPKDGKPYLAELITVVSVVDLSRLQPGAIINIKYDPEQPTHVALAGK